MGAPCFWSVDVLFFTPALVFLTPGPVSLTPGPIFWPRVSSKFHLGFLFGLGVSLQFKVSVGLHLGFLLGLFWVHVGFSWSFFKAFWGFILDFLLISLAILYGFCRGFLSLSFPFFSIPLCVVSAIRLFTTGNFGDVHFYLSFGPMFGLCVDDRIPSMRGLTYLRWSTLCEGKSGIYGFPEARDWLRKAGAGWRRGQQKQVQGSKNRIWGKETLPVVKTTGWERLKEQD